MLAGIALLLLGGCRELEGFSTGPGEAYRGSIVASQRVTVDGGETDIDPIRRGIDTDGDTLDDVLQAEIEERAEDPRGFTRVLEDLGSAPSVIADTNEEIPATPVRQ